jgi:hypothetical protein
VFCYARRHVCTWVLRDLPLHTVRPCNSWQKTLWRYQVRIATIVHNIGRGKWDRAWGSAFWRLITLLMQPPAFREKLYLQLLHVFVNLIYFCVCAIFGSLICPSVHAPLCVAYSALIWYMVIQLYVSVREEVWSSGPSSIVVQKTMHFTIRLPVFQLLCEKWGLKSVM